MGLDMYLRAERYFGGWDHAPEKEREKFTTIADLLGLDPTADSPSLTVRMTVVYWRKANAIHKWFVDNVQEGNDDCGSYYVERGQLAILRDLCKELVLSGDDDLALEKLPPTSGFFFGGTEIDEWYWGDLARTAEELDALLVKLAEDDLRMDLYYQSSW